MGESTNTDTAALTTRQREWLSHIQACEASDQAMRVYAAEHHLSVHAMYAAKGVLVRKGFVSCSTPVRFAQAQVLAPVVDRSQWRVDLPNGVSVAFEGAVDGGTLATVLDAAAGVAH